MTRAQSQRSGGARAAAPHPWGSGTSPRALSLTILLTLVLHLGFPAPVRAQLLRYELGRRVQNLEAAWDAEGNETRRTAALPLIQEAVKNFFSLNQTEAALKIIQARWQLVGGEIPLQQTLAEQLIFEPKARLVDLRDLNSFSVVAKGFRSDLGLPKMNFKYELRAGDGKLIAAAETMLPLDPCPLNVLPAIPPPVSGDGALDVTLVFDEQQIPIARHTITLVADLKPRLKALRDELAQFDQAKPVRTTTASESLRDQLGVLTSLAKGDTLETNYPAWSLLQDAESLLGEMKQQVARPRLPRRGQYWRTLVADSGAKATVRIWVPDLVTDAHPPPLVIALHGVGGSENMFFDMLGVGKVVRLCQERGWPIIAPRQSLLGGVGLSLEQLVAEVRQLYPVDTTRIFLVGHSMGAMQAVKLTDQAIATQGSIRPALIAALGGGGNATNFSEMKSTKFFVGVGKLDFARRGGIQLVDKLRRAGVPDVEFKDYDDTEHLLIVQTALADVFRACDGIVQRNK